MGIRFFSENVKFKLKDKRIISNWIKFIIVKEGRTVGDINFIFSSDSDIIEINRTFLKHDYYTDIITFNYNKGFIISGDIYISVDTVKLNAIKFKVSVEKEINRVMIHGILHLIGYDDTDKILQTEMRDQENDALYILESRFLQN